MTRHVNGGVRKVCGCPRRGWAKCPHPWHFSFKHQGKHYRFSLDRQLGKRVESKADAIEAAADVRKLIRAGTFGQPAPREAMTLRELADVYTERYVRVERASTEREFGYALAGVCRTVVPRPVGQPAPLGEWRATDVTTDTVERYREVRRGQGVGLVAINRGLQTFRALFNWAVRVGYVEKTPFKRGSEPVVKLQPEPQRSRRLHDDEEDKLLAAANPHLRAVIEAALETGMRRGEILSLQWKQIEGMKVHEDKTIVWAPRAEIVLPWSKTKTRRERRIPISARLRALLDMRRFDPSGAPLEADTYVFGTTIGTRVLDFKRAWTTAVLVSHGFTPDYTKTANFAPASRKAIEAIDLHFHDLRREAGSRWLEGGVPLHTVRDWLGHVSIAQTSTYLANTARTQHDAMRRFDEQRGALQPFATDAKSGGPGRPRSAGRGRDLPRKAAARRDSAVS